MLPVMACHALPRAPGLLDTYKTVDGAGRNFSSGGTGTAAFYWLSGLELDANASTLYVAVSGASLSPSCWARALACCCLGPDTTAGLGVLSLSHDRQL